MRNLRQLQHFRHRIGDDLGNRRIVIGKTVHEGGVGAVLQQAADEIGEKVFVAAHWRIDAAGLADETARHHLLVQRLTHAVQALELVAFVVPCHDGDRRHRLRIVGGELREETIPPRQHVARTGEIAHVGRNFAGEDRERLEPAFLGPLDLGVPISALHKAHGQDAAGLFGEGRQPFQRRPGPAAVGLHGKAKAVPAVQLGCGSKAAEEFERDVETRRLLRIDGEADVALLRRHGEVQHAGVKLGQAAVAGLLFIAGMERRKLHRNGGCCENVAALRCGAHGLYGLHIGGLIALGIWRRHGAFAQHVEGEAPALAGQRLGGFKRFLDRPPKDELLAHDAHGLLHGGADDRLAGARDQLLERGKATRAR